MVPRSLLIVLALCATATGSAAAQASAPLGEDAPACTSGQGPAVRVDVQGLKDRTGRMKLELYPANAKDFLKDDRDLKKEGKPFRRVWADMPKSGSVSMCIRAPSAGRWAVLFTHDRDMQNKFNVWKDGVGFASGQRIGLNRPQVQQAVVDVRGVTTISMRVQYLRSVVSGFGPIKG